MRTALMVADVVAGLGVVLLVVAGPSNMAPGGVVLPIGLAVLGLMTGVVLRFAIARSAKDRRDKPSTP